MQTAAPLTHACFRLDGVRVTIVGGGKVGQRKARWAAKHQAIVTIIDPQPSYIPEVTWVSEKYRKDHLSLTRLVFACATTLVNDEVVRDAIELGLWVSDASQPERGNFITPAIGEIGSISIAVSTGGASPNLAMQLRDELLAAIDPTAVLLVQVFEKLRPEILATIPDESKRREWFRQFASPEWRARLKDESPEVVLAAMKAVISSEEPLE
ncbi:MAG: precorrin-2 dehydrogenase/sirohydrochlorin ferrochelatase family protein [Fimbriiglobus sp.]